MFKGEQLGVMFLRWSADELDKRDLRMSNGKTVSKLLLDRKKNKDNDG